MASSKEWMRLADSLSNNDFHFIRHDYGRKCGNWDEVDQTVLIPQELADKLFVFTGDIEPMDSLPPEVDGSIFIFNHPTNGKRYLVNTEGYNYCRYVAEMLIKQEYFSVVITNRDPIYADSGELDRVDGCHTNYAEAKKIARDLAKRLGGFGTVYSPEGESMYEIDFVR